MPGTRRARGRLDQAQQEQQPAEAHEGVGRRGAPEVHPARERPAPAPPRGPRDPAPTRPRGGGASSARPGRGSPPRACRPARTPRTGRAGKREPVLSSSQGARASGRRAERPEDQTSGVAAITAKASAPAHRVQCRPATHCRTSTKSWVAAITWSASQAKKQRALGRARRPDRLPEREVGKVQEVADAEDEQEPPGPSQARAQRERARAGAPPRSPRRRGSPAPSSRGTSAGRRTRARPAPPS